MLTEINKSGQEIYPMDPMPLLFTAKHPMSMQNVHGLSPMEVMLNLLEEVQEILYVLLIIYQLLNLTVVMILTVHHSVSKMV